MTQHKIILGDWGGDGHTETSSYLLEIPDQFTTNILVKNYYKNSAELNVDPTTFAVEYEDNIIPVDVVESLVAAGLPLEEFTDSYEEGVGAATTPNEMLNILMFLFGRGLEGFTWKHAQSEVSVLIGNFKAPIDSVGYGLYEFSGY